MMGEFKQELLKIHNTVNMEIFYQGLVNQRVEIHRDKAIIIARNHRVKVLSIVDQHDKTTSRMVDLALLAAFKERFRELANAHFGVPILSLIKDYDPTLEMSVSVVFYHQPIEELLHVMRTKDIT